MCDWISVIDKLPKDGENVIVYYPKFSGDYYWPSVFSARYKKGKHGVYAEGFRAYDSLYNIGGPDGITHWIQIPKFQELPEEV